MLRDYEPSTPSAGVPVLLRVAFATKMHADQALAMITRCDDLFASVAPHRCSTTHDGMGLVDIVVPIQNRDRVTALATGLHGIVVRERDGSSLTDAGHRPDADRADVSQAKTARRTAAAALVPRGEERLLNYIGSIDGDDAGEPSARAL